MGEEEGGGGGGGGDLDRSKGEKWPRRTVKKKEKEEGEDNCK